MMRDFLLQHKNLSVVIITTELAGLYFLASWNLPAGLIAVSLYWLVMGHLVWGTPLKAGEQEEPEYTEPEH